MEIRIEHKQCFFCDKYLIPQNISDGRLYREWQKEYGYIAKEAGQIGPKSLCKDCVSDIVGLVQYDIEQF